MIYYVTKEKMAEVAGSRHYFGYALPCEKKAYVREDLPTSVRLSVAAHEQYHLDDVYFYGKSVAVREWDAVKAQFKAEPIGTLMLLVMSLHPSRISLIIKRMKRAINDRR